MGSSEGTEARWHLTGCLSAVAAGDRAALAALYRLTSAKLFGVCLRILSDRQEAEDVLQEVYLTVWNKAHRFEAGRASPITWLVAIARNRAIDRLRARAPRAREVGVEAAEVLPDLSPDAVARLERDEEARALAACLGTLDERTRGAVTAAFYGGRTYDELAREAAMPLATMKSLIRRALIRLKGCLEG